MVSVDAMQHDPRGIDEFWTLGVPQKEVGPNTVDVCVGHPFWFQYARSQRIYPHLAANRIRLIDVHQTWYAGNVLRARFLVWQRHHMLHVLAGSALEAHDEVVGHTFFCSEV